MKTALILSFIIFQSLLSFSQTNKIVFLNPGSGYYDSTDFSKSDSLKDWFYVLVNKDYSYSDSVKPIGQLIFQKNRTTLGWTGNFIFRIFELKDSSYCFKKSKSLRALSSCTPPNVGGDIVIIDHYIFLNTSSCVQCRAFGYGHDCCRPVINKILSSVHSLNMHSLKSLVSQFPIKGESIGVSF